MRKLATFIAAGLLTSGAWAQDFHFAQTYQTPQLINPAAVGVFDGWERVMVNHRNQWLGSGTQFMTTAVAADANIGKGHINNKAHLGVGLMFFNDIGGDSRFGNQAGSVTLSGILPMDGGTHVLSAGIQGGYGSRSMDLSSVTFLNQWDGNGFNTDLPSGEGTGTSFSYIDANAGIQYVFDGGKSTFRRNNDTKIRVGVAGYHLNAPRLQYSNGVESERLHRKYVANLGVIYEIPGSVYSFDVNAVQFMQGGHYETLLGLMMRYRFEDGTKITGMSQNAYFGVGVYGRLKDAIIPSVMIDWRGFKLGISYDVTLSALRNAYRGGSLEFSLSYVNMHDALFKTRKRRI